MADEVSEGGEALAQHEALVAAANEAAVEIVALNVADLTAKLPELDLLTLRAVLAAEEAKGENSRKSATTAIEAAIDAHPDQVAARALASNEPPEGGEALADEAAPEAAPTYILMVHPDGGVTDGKEFDEEAQAYRVDLADIDHMLSHGFVPAPAKDAE